MTIVKTELKTKGTGTYTDILYPKTSADMIEGLQTAIENVSDTKLDARGYQTTKLIQTGSNCYTIGLNGKFAGNNLVNAPTIGTGAQNHWYVYEIIMHTTPGYGFMIASGYANAPKKTYINTLEDNVWQGWKQIATNDEIGILSTVKADKTYVDTQDNLKIAKTQIKNTLTETVAGNVLDATQGKALNDQISILSDKTKHISQTSIGTNTSCYKFLGFRGTNGVTSNKKWKISLPKNRKMEFSIILNGAWNQMNALGIMKKTFCYYDLGYWQPILQSEYELIQGSIQYEFAISDIIVENGECFILISSVCDTSGNPVEVSIQSDTTSGDVINLITLSECYGTDARVIPRPTYKYMDKIDISFPYISPFDNYETEENNSGFVRISDNGTVVISFGCKKTDDSVIFGDWINIGKLPSNIKPTKQVRFVVNGFTTNELVPSKTYKGYVDVSGLVVVRHIPSNDGIKRIDCNFSY